MWVPRIKLRIASLCAKSSPWSKKGLCILIYQHFISTILFFLFQMLCVLYMFNVLVFHFFIFSVARLQKKLPENTVFPRSMPQFLTNYSYTSYGNIIFQQSLFSISVQPPAAPALPCTEHLQLFLTGSPNIRHAPEHYFSLMRSIIS